MLHNLYEIFHILSKVYAFLSGKKIWDALKKLYGNKDIFEVNKDVSIKEVNIEYYQ
jgi:hypothetical protein